ncbi:hypothetical protein ACA910_022732 [Epithemia clementina (nom. ined.)]
MRIDIVLLLFVHKPPTTARRQRQYQYQPKFTQPQRETLATTLSILPSHNSFQQQSSSSFDKAIAKGFLLFSKTSNENENDENEITKEWNEINSEEGKLREDRFERLEALFLKIKTQQEAAPREILSREYRWLRRYKQLIEYAEIHGDCLVPRYFAENPALGNWVLEQRQNYRKMQKGERSRITWARKYLLKMLGFDWDPFQTVWMKQYGELVEYSNRHGDCFVPAIYPENQQLATWVGNQRTQFHKMQNNEPSFMTVERQQLLERIGFYWDPCQTFWMRHYESLVDYAKQHGDCLVPLKHAEKPELGHWVSNQRAEFQKMQNNKPSSLTVERQQLLEAIGFDWDPLQTLWTKRQEYRKMQNNEVSFMNKERQQLLETIGFSWTFGARWEKQYKELVEYAKRHGNCLVPKRYADNPQLGVWVSKQRQEYRKMKKNNQVSSMNKERQQRLDMIGFDWDGKHSFSAKWETRYNELAEYVKRHGDCLVPYCYVDNHELGRWVSRQRTAYKKRINGKPSSLTQVQVDLLERIGFVWDSRASFSKKQ